MNSFPKSNRTMRSRLTKIFLMSAALIPMPALAAEAVPATSANGFNPVLLGMVSIIIVLMAAIALLANVLKQLAFAYRDKFRRDRSNGTVMKSVLLFLFAGTATVQAMAQEGGAALAEEPVVVAVAPYINGIPRADFYLISGVIFFELALLLVVLSMVFALVRIMRDIPEKKPLLERILAMNLLDYFNKSVSIEKEHTIVIDHDYDGIHELDNSLPPWWKWGFVMTIVFAFAYMWYYHVADGPNQIAEYAASVEKAEKEQLVYLAKSGSSVDENNVTIIVDAGKLAAAQTIFNNTCAACHRQDGGGTVGPNLTDEYWLHGGSLQDVFKSVKYGWKDKGMPEWQHNLSPAQIAGVTSFIMSLKGKNPPGAKEPQGERFVENAPEAPADSVSAQGNPLTQSTGKEKIPGTNG